MRTDAILLAAFGLWLAHGLMIDSAPITVFNALNLGRAGAILVLKLRSTPAPADQGI